MTVSPKVTQDLKNRVVEVDEDGNIKLNGESVVAGKDPSNPGHDPSKGNMADQNINKPPIGQALGVKELISTPLLNTHHPNEGLSNVLVEDGVGNAAEADQRLVTLK